MDLAGFDSRRLIYASLETLTYTSVGIQTLLLHVLTSRIDGFSNISLNIYSNITYFQLEVILF